MIISDNYGIFSPKVFKSMWGETAVAVPSLIFGLELEIEKFDPEYDRDFAGVDFTEDGSLRSDDDGIGIEAITKPIQAKHIQRLLESFYQVYEITDFNYTERCSTHVHMNVLNLTYEQLAILCLVYQTVESLLFKYAEENRKNSIFCVPWNQCGLNYQIVNKLIKVPENGDMPIRHWQKYSALNLLPISTQGSIEFRHLEGTCNVKKIMGWINILSKMYKYASNTSFQEAKQDIVKMNTVSNYYEWLNKVFEECSDMLKTDGFERELSVGVVDSKLALLNPFNRTFSFEEQIEQLRNMTNPINTIPIPIFQAAQQEVPF